MTAVEWLVEKLIEKGFDIPMHIEDKALQMEAEQSKAIPELSDDEIERAASAYSAVNSINKIELKEKYNDFVYACKWYREQLKQRQ